MYARGIIVEGQHGARIKTILIRAALGKHRLSIKRPFRAIIEDGGLGIRTLKVDSGASANDFLMQFRRISSTGRYCGQDQRNRTPERGLSCRTRRESMEKSPKLSTTGPPRHRFDPRWKVWNETISSTVQRRTNPLLQNL